MIQVACSPADMLYLNKQRLIAIEELQKAERDRELLLTKVSQLESEVQASEMEKDLLGQRLKASEGSIALAESRAGDAPRPPSSCL
jgi:hypothetical protein